MKIFAISHVRWEKAKFYHRLWREEERICCKALQQTHSSPPTEYAFVFLRWEKFLPESYSELTEQPLVYSVPTLKVKTKYSVHIMVLWVVTSDGDIMPPCIFPHGRRLNSETYIKCLDEVVLLWNWDGGYWKTLPLPTGLHDTQTGEPSVSCQKIFVTTAFGCLTPRIAIFLIIICGAQLSERTTKFHAAPKMNWRQG